VASLSLTVGWLIPRSSARPQANLSVEQHLARAKHELERDRPEAAAKALDAVLAVQPEQTQALLLRGQTARLLGLPEEALRYWQRVPNRDRAGVAKARFLGGTLRIESGQAVPAEQAWRDSASRNPGSTQARERLVNLFVTQLRGAEAREMLEEIARVRPWTPIELVLGTLAGNIVENPETAIPRLQLFVKQDAHDLASRCALGRYLVETERPEEVIRLFAETPREQQDHAAWRVIVVEAWLSIEAESAVPRLANFWPRPPVPDDPDWWAAYGLCASQDDAWGAAEQALAYAVARRPDSAELRYRYGIAVARHTGPAEGDAILNTAALMKRMLLSAERVMHGDQRRTDLLVPIVLETGQLLGQLNRWPDAARWVEMALRLDPASTVARQQAEQVRSGLARGMATRPSVPVPPEVPRLIATGATTWKLPASHAAATPPSGITFVDEGPSRGLDFTYEHGHSELSLLLESTGGGVACLDFDADGQLDFFFPQGACLDDARAASSPGDALYHRRGERFVDHAEPARVASRQYGQGVAAGDWNNDGHIDLVVGNYGSSELYQNQGDGTFLRRPLGPANPTKRWTASLGWGDLDNDGDLDLFQVNYLADAERVCRDPAGRPRTCNPTNYEAEPDQLWENLGDGRFQDISAEAGIIDRDGKGLGVILADLDGDQRLDIYVSNDGTPNHLYRNLPPASSGRMRFEEVGMTSGAAMSGQGMAQAGMGIACGDLSGTGRWDLYVTNFMDDVNTFYRNEGDLCFTDRTAQAGLASPTRLMLGFGTQALDVDLDGRQDLFVANGHIGDFRDQGIPWKMRPQLFRNLGGSRFEELLPADSGYMSGEYLGRGVARCDWNRDGRPDLVVVHQDHPAALLTNSGTMRAGLTLRLIGIVANRDAIGAEVTSQSGSNVVRLPINGGDGYLSTNEHAVTLPRDAEHDTRVEVRWPGGTRSRHILDGNQREHVIQEPFSAEKHD
jgi:tetratricopeptide (TPR) repeat protein